MGLRKKFDFQKDVAYLKLVLADKLNATDTDISAFQNAGGKLLMIHGMADPIIPYRDPLEYYQAVVRKDGGMEKTRAYFRCYMIPGLGHVAGGSGIQDITAHGFKATLKDKEYDALVALAEWVNNDYVSDCILAVAFEDGNILNGIMKDLALLIRNM